MTLIAAVRGATGPAILASDSYLGESGSTVHDRMGAPKIEYVGGGMWIGLAGDPSMWGRIVHGMISFPEGADMRLDLASHMDLPTDKDFGLLAVRGREIWAIDQAMSAYPIMDPYTAIGIGRDFAMGVMSALVGPMKRNPKKVLKKTMTLTADRVAGVCAPFDYSDLVLRT